MTTPRSGEETIVSLDYFTQHRVESVEDGGPNDGVWTIKFEGGGIIVNFDPTIEKPKTIVGAGMSRLILSGKRTRIQFGLEEVVLNPLEYAMSDPVYTKGTLIFAQRSDANMPPTVPEHPDERVADGPTGRDPEDEGVDEDVEDDSEPAT